jgi:hypothetical protein
MVAGKALPFRKLASAMPRDDQRGVFAPRSHGT